MRRHYENGIMSDSMIKADPDCFVSDVGMNKEYNYIGLQSG